ncbi:MULTISPECIES: adenylate/guanylate cyclase domain-containing protein [unclassified Bradyrhizobium]|uniref:CHASE2 domain-containing protein n=1 Tax=unclassified Bradyrhizobium TaxID=2631580 RepID=UPI0024783892|nr:MULTISPECIES: adenylate/guanylate cyclase domain-containing protein [unclassified Bradyrhizobium]WGR74178.1 adenylate/guanylate cyclase domain-containing protein [Bradyrhizobium sp. ISRA426]WGR79013.1 adenylate/guanylate cyclase domain-containing protein [Bradyrhizobium sp. ISRA430]WGR89417.1 adenylate/guanylate cyclase domain-containing protein [Bradyrhizobium sp. ISRA432]
MSSQRVEILVALVLTALWGGSIYAGHANGHLRFLDRLEATLTDLRTLARGPQRPPDLVTIVAIDDTVVKRGGRYPLPRADLARVVDAIAQFKPKVVAIDLLLVDRGGGLGDATLARSLAASPTILAAAAIFPTASDTVATSSEGPLATLPQAERFLLPLAAFTDHAEVGVVNVATGQSGSPLSVPMLFRTHDKVELSFPLRVASRALDKPLTIAPDHLMLGDRTVRTDTDFALPITYYGPRRTIRTVSAQTIFDGTLDRGTIEDRIVVIGASVAGGGDFFPTPFDSLMPGVEVVSTAITHLVAGDGIVRDRRVHIADALAAILLPMLLVGLLAWRRSAIGIIAAAAVMTAWAALNLFAFTHGIWLNGATTLAAAVPPVAVFAGVQLWATGRRTQYLAAKSRSLAQFQAPAVQEWLARDPDFLAKPVRQNAAVVFIDLSGFTSLSERIDPDTLRDLLKAFHALVDKTAVSSGGIITDFLGDGAMILFGLPRAMPDDAARAVTCSVDLHRAVQGWLASLPPSIGDRLSFKIGAHFGPIVASRLGGSHQHITATGDTVNVASRLMEVAAQHDAKLALSDTLLDAADFLGDRDNTLRGPLRTQIRGRSGTVTVWFWRDERQPRQAAAGADVAG